MEQNSPIALKSYYFLYLHSTKINKDKEKNNALQRLNQVIKLQIFIKPTIFK